LLRAEEHVADGDDLACAVAVGEYENVVGLRCGNSFLGLIAASDDGRAERKTAARLQHAAPPEIALS
jgi:hypothetical protein